MNVSRRWLEAFLGRELSATDVREELAMLGAPVDAIEALHADLRHVVVALVESVSPHPNADKLQLCLVNDGTAERRHVVCGAPNVAAGRKYPFAPVGAVLPGDFKIEKRKIRGELSEGMLCSARELGLGQEHDGILELGTEAAPGTPLLEALPLADDRFVVDVTPNRPDLLGHKGIARELAFAYGVPFRLPAVPGSSGAPSGTPRRVEAPRGGVAGVAFGTDDADGCPRFHGAVIRGVKVTPSPAWLRNRLEAVGVRAINSVVDVTNYVLFELGQPMHAYDLSKLAGPELVARRARLGETLVTLDDVSRRLTPEMTVIADRSGAIGVAGVMGAAHVEVTDSTSDLFLEAAYFDPRRVRRTRRALGLSTEASYRFERGVDRWNAGEAIRRCVEIILAVAGGTLAEGIVDVWPVPTTPPRIFLRTARVRQVLGVELPRTALERYLTAIGATVLYKPEDERLAVDVPGWRPDLVQEIDLIEEIARLHGYDNFPDEVRPFRASELPEDALELAAGRVRRGLVECGLFEAQMLQLGPSEGPDSVALLNPLSAEEGFLRRSLLPGLLRGVEANWSRQVRNIRLFEVGTVFRANDAGLPPLEEPHVAGVVSGGREPEHWTAAGKGADFDLWDVKRLFEAAVALAIPGATVQVDKQSWLAVSAEGRLVGRAAPLRADLPPWAAPVYGFELLLDPAPRAPVRFGPLPVTQSAQRDVALVLPPGLAAGQVEAALQGAGGKLLESVRVFDEYRGSEMPAGHRSVAFRLTFRAPDRTLETAEVDSAVRRAVAQVEKELGVHLRSS